MIEYFESNYGPGIFELVLVKDVAAKGALDEVVKGCDGVIQTASNVSFSPDPTVVLPESMSMVINSLESALTDPNVKRFVLTSSSSAVTQGLFDQAYDLSPDHWNDKAVEAAKRPPPYGPDRIIETYAASKTLAEKAMFDFVKERKPHFVVNSVLPDFVAGKILKPEKQGYSSSVGLFYALFMNQDGWQTLPSQYGVDSSDVGRLHVAALARQDAQNERIFGYAFPKDWTKYIAILKDMYPDRQFSDPPSPDPKYIPNVLARPRAEDLLKWLGRDGFTG